MSGLTPGAFITFDGESIPGRVPPRLIVRDNPMSKDQHAAVKHVYQEFVRHNGLSLAAYQVRDARLSDGTRVRMESNSGVDRVTVWPGRSGAAGIFDIRPLALFVSLEAPFGVRPGDPMVVPRSMSEERTASWWNNAPFVRGGDMEFTHGHRATLNTRRTGISFPGTMDWYDDRGKESPNFGLVITWWSRYPDRSNWSLPDKTEFSDTGLNWRQAIGLIDDTFGWANLVGRYVWCNGIHIATLPSGYTVESACLHTNDDEETVLRVLASRLDYYYVYEGPIHRDTATDASQGYEVTLEQTLAIHRGESRLLHPPHCNDTGTRAVLVVRTHMESGEYLWELDLSTGDTHAVEVPWTPQDDAAYLASYGHPVGSYWAAGGGELYYSDSHGYSLDAEHYSYHVIAADYRKGALEYIYCKSTESSTVESSGSYSNSSVRTDNKGDPIRIYESSGDGSASAHQSANVSWETFLIHSVLGEIQSGSYGWSEAYVGVGSASYAKVSVQHRGNSSGSSSDEQGTATWSHTVTITHTGNLSGEVSSVGLVGDLRALSFDTYLTHGNRSERISSFETSGSRTIDTKITGWYNSGYAHSISNNSSDSITFGGPDNGQPNRTYVKRTRFINGSEVGSALLMLHEDHMEPSDSSTQVTSPLPLSFVEPIDIGIFTASNRGYLYRSIIDIGIPGVGVGPNGTYVTDGERRSTPAAANVRHAVVPLCATSSFDGELYYVSTIDWPTDGAKTPRRGGEIDTDLLLFDARVYDVDTSEELFDLNADPDLNPCPGDGKTCATMMFLGPVRDDANGRYTDIPMYLMKPDED